MMKQFKQVKENYPDAILFFRVGDFYELFFEDAVTAARELEIALTSRDGNKEDAIPLAGVPFHSLQNYVGRLLEKGYKVAICDQVEDPGQARGLVKREITRIITPGTKYEDNLLLEDANNYLASLRIEGENFGLSLVDVSTGEVEVYGFEGSNAVEKVFDELFRLRPAEIILDRGLSKNQQINKMLQIQERFSSIHTWENDLDEETAFSLLGEHFSRSELQESGLASSAAAVFSTAMALAYIRQMQRTPLTHLQSFRYHGSTEEIMVLDAVTLHNLEISETLRTGAKKGSLLGILDRTKTAMGGRMLRKWLERPLMDKCAIESRWESLEELKENQILRAEIGELLKNAYDLERLSSRVNMGAVYPRDLLALKNTLYILPLIEVHLEEAASSLLRELGAQLPNFSTLSQKLEDAVSEEAPASVKEGGIFKEGYSQEVDELRQLARSSRDWILSLEKYEKVRTGIKSLKIRYNKVFGYYIEITKTNLHLVPQDYLRKQTLVNAERFITEGLKEKESQILHAEERLAQLEFELFEALRLDTAQYTPELQKASRIVASLDCLISLAEAAFTNNYVKPSFSGDGDRIAVREGRHPVVEQLQGELFIPNPLSLDSEKERVLLITGPNMAGKSTYCRGAALLLVMAQAGSFVPAEAMEFFPVDRIFARVGASDDLSGGRSTFMVEMEETATILQNATPRSLVILDEIGRGTSTYDGMSLAQAILEYLLHHNRALVLFSTHYHELTAMEEIHRGIVNYSMAVKEKGEEIIFLRKVIPGKADRSYGINVARLAGLPERVMRRAQEVLQALETQQASPAGGTSSREGGEGEEGFSSPDPGKLREEYSGQLSFLAFPGKKAGSELSSKEKKVLQEIKNLNLVNITPLESLNKLFQLQAELTSRDRFSQ